MNPSNKIASFEGLRGIAACIVLLAHLRLAFWTTCAEDIWPSLSSLPPLVSLPLLAFIKGLYNGTVAVWLFWIMSAFVLSLQFFTRTIEPDLPRAHHYLKEAFLRRYPRLLIPVLVSVLFAYVLHAAHLMHNAELARTLGEPYASGWLSSWYGFPADFAAALKSAVWQSFFAYDDATSYNNVLWTMEKEFYGSLFLFAFLALVGHRRSRILFYVLTAFACRSLHQDWLNAFVSGIALCDLFVNHPKSLLLKRVWHSSLAVWLRGPYVVAALWIVVITGSGLKNYQGMVYLALGTLAVALTLVSAHTQRVLSHAALLFLGRISFGLYLVHVPIICSVSCWAYLAALAQYGHAGAALLSAGMTCVLSVAGGYLFFILADRPSIRLSRLFSSWVLNAPARAPQQIGPAVTAAPLPPATERHMPRQLPPIAEL